MITVMTTVMPRRRQAETMSHDTHSPDGVELHQHIARRLAQHDQRYTPARRRLAETLSASGRPLTLPDIVALAPDLAQSSIYRNLDVLERCGLVQRISANADHAHFELTEPLIDHHHHLICLGCGAIEDVHLDDDIETLVDERLAAAAATTGFTPQHHTLDLHGHCADCTA